MRSLWLAVGFLTAFPAPDPGAVTGKDFRRSRAFYPIVGLLLGVVTLLVAYGCRRFSLPAGVEGALVLATGFLATGFLHLDGLLDCADGLLAPVPPERRLAILKDVHMGSFAFGVGVCALLVHWQLLAARPPLSLLLLLPVLSRAAVLLPMSLWPYARRDGSGILASSPWDGFRQGLPALSVAILLAMPATWLFPWPALGVLCGQLAFSSFAAPRLGGGLTGDCYGAAIVLSETCGLLAWTVVGGIPLCR